MLQLSLGQNLSRSARDVETHVIPPSGEALGEGVMVDRVVDAALAVELLSVRVQHDSVNSGIIDANLRTASRRMLIPTQII